MSRLDSMISDLNYILDVCRTYRDIEESGQCNNCVKKKNCEYAPKPGQLVRYNCPFYEEDRK